jgi:predicted GTPase
VQRFATYEDLDKEKCTIEEMEEYEPYVERGMVIYAGVDYEAILREAEKEADVVLWDGGNNDMSFYKPDFLITVADAHRPNHEFNYYPGEVNFRAADVIIISKIDSAKSEDVATIEENAKRANPNAVVIKAESKITVKDGEKLRGKRVIVVEDGPTLTHGGMSYGAGIVAAKRLGCKIVDARPYAAGSIKHAFAKYKQLDCVLPAMGYDATQMKELEQTIENASGDTDAVLVGTPIDLARHIKIKIPTHRVYYDYVDEGGALKKILEEKGFL